MLKHFAFCIALLFLYYVQLSAQTCHSFELMDDVHHSDVKSISTDSIGLAPTGNYDLIYHRISVTVDPAVHYISGSVTTFFKPFTSLSQIAFDLTDSLSTDLVYYHGQAISTFTHYNNALTIILPNTVSRLDSVTIYYSGAPPVSGFGSFVTDMHDSVPELWTLSEPYGSRDWFPGKMTLTDKADSMDFYINVPIGNRAASNGLLIDTMRIGNTVTYHWHEGYPIANYLIAMGVTNYVAYADTVATDYGNIYVLNYVYPENLADWHAEDSNIMAALQLYSKFFGPYPFIKEKYGHAQFGWGGGMEHQTMSFVYNTSFELINHEMAHQWFGDKLTCDSWSEIWLNEGFAMYLSALCYEYIAPSWWWNWRTVTLGNIIQNANKGSIYCADTNSVSRIFYTPLTYRKAAYTLHMLRWELGDSAFFAGLRGYMSDTALSYNFSKATALQHHLEAASGMDLSVFFADWIYGVGYPSYALDWSQKSGLVSCKISQTTSDPSVAFYAMDVPVRFYGNNTDSTVIIHHTYSGQAYTCALPFTVDSVVIDPELWLISGNNVARKLPVIGQENFLLVYPNPVTDIITIWYDSKNLNQVNYSIYDMQGQRVAQQTLSGGSDYFTASLAGLSGGVYVIKINTESGSLSQRIVKY
jgi:hypothetical protein